MLGIWVVMPCVLVSVFRSGVDNHTLLAPGLAIVGGIGLASVRVHGAALGVAVVHIGLGWTSIRAGAGVIQPAASPSLIDVSRPHVGFGAEELSALFDATCADMPPHRCIIGADRGLFAPYSAGPAHLELYLIDEERVVVEPIIGISAARRPRRLRAMASYDCPGTQQARDWAFLNPQAEQERLRRVEAEDLQRVWSQSGSPECTVEWWEPRGRVRRPDLLPSP